MQSKLAFFNYLALQYTQDKGVALLSIRSQMLKGILEGCMLVIIAQQEVYGYELSIKLKEKGLNFVSEGSIYPLLQRMQREKLIVGTLRDSPAGPQRKYYNLTSEGKNALVDFLKNWQLVKSAVDNLIESKGAESL